MRHLAIATTVLALAASGTALAADLPVKSPILRAAPVAYSWTGCYIGAGGGYGMWNQDHQALSPTLVTTGPSATAGGRGWFGTVDLGCDYQFADRWVVGVFGNYDFSSLKGDFNPVGTPFVGQEKLTSSWAAGGRLGYLVLPRLLAYVSGGYTQARFNQVDLLAGTFFTVPTTLSMSAQTYNGWFLGSGYEYALDFLPGLFWKTEYRFATYQAQNVPVYLSTLGTTTLVEYERNTKYVQTVRSELVWRFNWGSGPVVARY